MTKVLDLPLDEVGTFYKAATVEPTRENGVYKFVSSDESTDRYGDVVRVKGWSFKNYKRNPIVLFGHSSSLPIGTTMSIEVKDAEVISLVKLAAEGTSDFIDTVRKLLDQRVLRAVSVGFRPTKAPNIMEDADGRFLGYEFVGQELLEQSIVSVPANANALETMKSMGARQRSLDNLVNASKSDSRIIAERMAARKRELALIRMGVQPRTM